MKSIKKILFIMVALAATLAFVSCSNGSDDGGSSSNNSSNNVSDNNNSSNGDNTNNNNGNANSGNNVSKPSVVATYEADREAWTLTFFKDNTFILTIEDWGEEREYARGTYDGAPSKNGYIALTITKEIGYNGSLRDLPLDKQMEYDIEIDRGSLYLEYISTYFTRQ